MEEGATESYGKLQVTLTSEEHTGSFSVRRFALSEDTLHQHMPTATAQAVRKTYMYILYVVCVQSHNCNLEILSLFEDYVPM